MSLELGSDGWEGCRCCCARWLVGWEGVAIENAARGVACLPTLCRDAPLFFANSALVLVAEGRDGCHVSLTGERVVF